MDWLLRVINQLPKELQICMAAGCTVDFGPLQKKGEHLIVKVKTRFPVAVTKIDGKYLVFEKKEG